MNPGINCDRCDAACDVSDRFCGNCGAALRAPHEAPPSSESRARTAMRPDRYELRGVLGHGASGTVYLAWDSERSREVAAKVLDPSLVAKPGFIERFRAEAAVLAGIEHPNVVSVLDYFEDQRGAWLITEYVHGASLAVVLARAPRLAAEQALAILTGALVGLQYTHGNGVVHGDIKPANILVSEQGVSKLADFGQAAYSGDSASAGTAAYMSPEAARGAPVDARSDIYSAGVVLYEALTGRLPFTATSDLALQRMHATQPPPRASGLHPQLADLLQRTLAKDPDERPQSVSELLHQLETAAEGAYGADWRRRASVDALIASLVAVGGVLAAGAPAAGAPSLPPAPAPGAHAASATTAPHAAGQAATRTSRLARLARTVAAHKTTSGLLAAAVVIAAGAGALLTKTSHGHTRLVSSSSPTIRSVSISGTSGSYTVTVTGSGFGSFAGSLPYTGDVPNFRIADSAQIGFGEWGYIGDANSLNYETWTDTKIVVGGLGAAPGDALVLAIWNRSSGAGVSWGTNVPPAPAGPRIGSVTFSGSASHPQIVIHGNGFGQAPEPMPYTGTVQSFIFSDWRAYHAGNGPSGTWTGEITEDFQSWSENTIVIDGFSGTYGQAPDLIEPGDPVTIQIWSPASGFDKGPQTAWGGRATFTRTTVPPPAPTEPPAASVIAHDEATVSAKYANCTAFSTNGCPFKVVSTTDGKGGSLYALELERITGDDCYRGIVYFFDQERLLGDTSQLAPNSSAGVVHANEAEPGRFAIGYAVSASQDTSCAENGNAGTDTYVYGLNGSSLKVVSGSLPPSPEWLVGTSLHPQGQSSTSAGSLVNTQSIAPSPVACGFSDPNGPVTFTPGLTGTIEPSTSMSLPAGFAQYLYVGSDAGGSPLSDISWQQDLSVTAAFSGNESISIGRSSSSSGSFNSGSATNVAIAGIALNGYKILRRFTAQTGSTDTLNLNFTTTAGDLLLILVGGEGDGLLQSTGVPLTPLVDLTYSECGSNVIASTAIFQGAPAAGAHTLHITAATYPTNSGVSLGAVAYVLHRT